jgi:sugar transferase (PEP-CTERM/EpsH1 system associated)
MRLLWLKTDVLHPVDKGGKIRTYHMLRELKHTHHITYLALDDGTAASDAGERASEYCHELIRVPHRRADKLSARFYAELVINLLSPHPYAVEQYRSAGFSRRVAEQIQAARVDLLVCDFLFPSCNVPRSVTIPMLLFQHNVEALIWRRHAEVQRNRLSRMYFHEQWRRMRSFEGAACRRFDAIVAVSPDDRALMEADYGAVQVHDIPTGVDTDYFRPSGTVPKGRFELVFTGSMDWLPNDDAMRYCIEDILPLIRRTIPDVRLTIVGRNPFPRLMELSRRDPRIVVTGRVDDVRPYMERATVCVVPLRIGGGTRLKVFEAMAMEKPLVSTSIGVEGLPVRDGEHALIADDPHEFARCVLRLLKEEAFAARVGRQAAEYVRREFGWRRVAEAFDEICRRTVERHTGLVRAA